MVNARDPRSVEGEKLSAKPGTRPGEKSNRGTKKKTRGRDWRRAPWGGNILIDNPKMWGQTTGKTAKNLHRCIKSGRGKINGGGMGCNTEKNPSLQREKTRMPRAKKKKPNCKDERRADSKTVKTGKNFRSTRQLFQECLWTTRLCSLSKRRQPGKKNRSGGCVCNGEGLNV